MNLDYDYMEEYNRFQTVDVYSFIESYEDDFYSEVYNEQYN